MILNSPYISGSLTVTGNANIQGQLTVTGSLSGTAATASFALTLGGTGSVGFATTGAFTATSGSASSRLTQIEQVYATTGSNSFRATQSITGSLTVTGQIIAQTINVQQVTSSIVYSSGSNVFGCDINSRQTFTGSFYQTGSVANFSNCVIIGGALSGTSAAFSGQITSDDLIFTAGTLFGTGNTGFSNRLSDTTLYLQMPATGFNITDNALNTRFIFGSNGVTTFSSTSGIGLTIQADWDRGATNNNQLYIRGNSNTNKQLRLGYDTTGNVGYIQSLTSGTSVDNLLINPSGGNVGIGTTCPAVALNVVAGNSGASGRIRLTHGSSSSQIDLYTGVSDGVGVIVNNNPLWFDINGTERMRITNCGQLTLGTSNSNGFTFRISSNACNNNDAKKIVQLGNDVINACSAYIYIGSYAGIDWLVGKDTCGAGDYRFNLSLYTGEPRMVLYTNGNYSFAGSNVSDIRLKCNINSLCINAIDKINTLVPKCYYMEDKMRYGFIAQDVKTTLPDLISGEEKEKEYLGLDYNGLLAVAVKAIQELKAENDIFKSCLGIS